MPPSSEKTSQIPEDKSDEVKSDSKDTEDDNQNVEIRQTRQITSVRSYSGPIPPADEFARYEEVYPGSAGRIFSMAEREQEDIVSFRNKSLLSATVVALATIAAIAYILTANPNALILLALAIAHVLPSITDFIRGMNDSALSKKERELEIQIRKDNHELDMIAAKQRLELGSGSEDSVTQRAQRLESSNESDDFLEADQ
ncbi:MAG: DUF2335 domain-containing protein [Chloroflexi bacterium]|nr:DUF2335 domain-containing protein [Chloroflexota bacterium]MCY3914588.1 DUF2335 domain-containing protein [Chloroflexota bacterium]